MSELNLNRQQFDILEVLATSKEKLSKQDFVKKTEYKVQIIDKVLEELLRFGYVKNEKITETGILALEPYRVKRAIIFAAGIGSRMEPITRYTPKPLVKVHGKRIIDGLLDAILEAQIEEIIVVRGYLSEQFNQLLCKYPMIKFIENMEYNEANNISSAMCVRELLNNTYIFEADLLLKNKKLIKKYHYTSNFLGVSVKKTEDWCFYTKNKIIQSLQFGGNVGDEYGIELYHTFGISYWSKKDGKQLAEDIEKIYHTLEGKEKYWDQVPFQYFTDNYMVEIRECSFEDILEIDTFEELQKIDNTYEE